MENRVRDIAAMGLLILTLGLAVAFTLVLTLTGMTPVNGMPVVVVSAPWLGSAEDLVRNTGGTLLSPWAAKFSAMALFEGEIPVDALKAAGAWAVFDAERLAELCGV